MTPRRLDEAETLPVPDGILDILPSGHASGPWEPDEVEELERLARAREA